MRSCKINNTINGISIANPESKQPFTPLFFISSATPGAEQIANEILKAINNDEDLSRFNAYKNKNI